MPLTNVAGYSARCDPNTIDGWRDCLSLSKPHVVRKIAEWAQDHIVLPSGPLAGERFKAGTHPVSRIWFDVLDSCVWQRNAISGPGQDGKSMQGFVIPTLHTLFERRETVFVGIPDMRLAGEKWDVDFRPTIESSFPGLMPTRGEGSKGGAVKTGVMFRNGARLKFMSAGHGDAGLAGPTTKNLVMTEVDKYDTAGEASRETDPIRQMEARTRVYRNYGRRIIMECTVSLASGRIWQAITDGTDSRLQHPCPLCEGFAAWEREHLVGWQDAENERQAAELARWECPLCNKQFTEDQRLAAIQDSRLVHSGQTVDTHGEVIGSVPAVETFGLRWSPFSSPFQRTETLGQDEWIAARELDQESAEKERRQFCWAIPYEPPDVELAPLVAEEVQQRSSGLKKGDIPNDCVGVAIGIDTGKRALHWEAKAVRSTGGAAIIEYGEQPVDCAKLGTRGGLVAALNQLKAYFDAGWKSSSGKSWQPRQVWIDSGYPEHKAGVYAFCRDAAKGLRQGQECYRPMKGHGDGQRLQTRYIAPRAKGKDVRYIGDEYHMTWQSVDRVILVHVNSDVWKANFHGRLAMPEDEPLAITLYQAPSPNEHIEYSRQVTAERQVENYIEGKGERPKWDRIRRQNHFLDAGYVATAAGEFILAEQSKEKPKVGWFAAQSKRGR
jgi:phage terminase large subunit GpA-like protein